MIRRPPRTTLIPYATLFLSEALEHHADVGAQPGEVLALVGQPLAVDGDLALVDRLQPVDRPAQGRLARPRGADDDDHLRSEEHTSELQSRQYLVCRLLLETT